MSTEQDAMRELDAISDTFTGVYIPPIPTVEDQLDDLISLTVTCELNAEMAWLQHALNAAKYQGGTPS